YTLSGSPIYLRRLGEILSRHMNPPLEVDSYGYIPHKSVLCSYDLVLTQQWASWDLLNKTGGVCSHTLIGKIVHGPGQINPDREDPDIVLYCSQEQKTLAHQYNGDSFFA